MFCILFLVIQVRVVDDGVCMFFCVLQFSPKVKNIKSTEQAYLIML